MNYAESKMFKSGSLSEADLVDHEKKFWASIEARVEGGEIVDAHRARAAYEFGIPEGDVTPAQRNAAKNLNFYRMYSVVFWQEKKPSTKITSKVCSNEGCGKEFVCSGDNTCWCMGLDTKKAIDPMKDCLCPDCMKKL